MRIQGTGCSGSFAKGEAGEGPALLRLRFWKELEKSCCPGGGARTVPQHPQPRHAALGSHPPPHLSAGQGAKVKLGPVPQASPF